MIATHHHDAAAKVMIFKGYYNNNILFMDDFDQKNIAKIMKTFEQRNTDRKRCVNTVV